MIGIGRRDLFKAAATALGTVRASRAAAAPIRQVNTVLGPLSPAELGRTVIHEHILVDIVGADRIAPGRYDGVEVQKVVLPHLKQLRSLGCTTFVDCTPAYQGRDPDLLARLAQASGLHILTNTGFVAAGGARYVPRFAFAETAEQLAARWAAEVQRGIPSLGIRPALITIGVDAGAISKIDSKLVSAAALTHLRTGLAIASHTGDGFAAAAQLDLLKSHGVPPAAFIWAHAQDEKNPSFHRKVAEAGAWVEFDGVSSETVDRNSGLIQEAKRAGYLRRVLISQDAVGYYVGQEHGGYSPGFAFMFSEFLPHLRKGGIDESEIRLLTIDNPRRALTLSP